MANGNPNWVRGVSGNPDGRPKGSRNKLAENLIAEFAADWEQHGKDVVAKVRESDPSKYLELAVKLVPKELLISIAPKLPGGLEPDEWSMMLETVAAIKERFPGNRAPGAVMEFVAEAIRLHTCRPVESGDSGGQLTIAHDIQTRGQKQPSN